MNLHLLPDSFYSARFIEFVGKNFSPDEHVFAIITSSKNARYIHKELKNLYVFSVRKYSDKFKLMFNKTMKELFRKSCRVYIHSLGGYKIALVYRYSNPMQKLTWLSWGYDIYEDMNGKLLEEETKKIISRSIELKSVIKNKILKPFKKRVIGTLDYIAMDYEEEFKLIQSNYRTNARYQEFHYPNPIDFTALDNKTNIKDFPELSKLNQFETLVLVGNSGTPNNNHLSILQLLKDLENKRFGVICPLSYGNPGYIEKIIKIGYELLGERFIPLTDFLKPDLYFALLNRVDVAIMNHYRQKGKGNIIPLIYLGKKVYLREDTTTYKALLSIGIQPGSIDKLVKGNVNDFFIPLSNEEIESNKLIMKNAYSEEETYRKMKNLFLI